ncbi:hypothetical protein N0V95_003967 [Ascochyta clinopodiicola]|nr:hypothetical protein N0V95_003967 [Ascochyta clinopodiicola]
MVAATENECERLRSELLQALKEQVAVDNELQSARKQLQRVRRERNIHQQAAADKKVDVKKASDEYAETVCRALCEGVYHRFPREVRDMIYSHIHPQYTLDIDADYFTSTKATIPTDDWNVLIVHHHIWDPAFVTGKVHAELMEQYFRSTTFEFQSFEHIVKFRVTDQWKTGYIPAQFPTNILVNVVSSNYDLGYDGAEDKDTGDDGWGGNANDNGWDAGGWRREPAPPQKTSLDLLADLDTLFGFHHATKLSINLVSDKHCKGNPLKKQDWMRKHLIPLVAPTLQRLRVSGYHIRFVLVGAWQYGHIFSGFIVDSFTSLEACNAQFEEFMSKAQEAWKHAQAKLEEPEDADDSDLYESGDTDSE